MSTQLSDFRQSLTERLQELLKGFTDKANAISGDAAPMITSIDNLSAQGKRIRALLAWYGWRGLGGAPEDPRILDAAASLELFQSAALIHDDIIDRSDTRRSAPSVHKQFESLHTEQHWGDDGAHFGIAAGILAGDLALAMSEDVFAAAAEATAYAPAARAAFNEMRFEVMIGQFLDLRSEVATAGISAAELRTQARTVVRYKSAHYSVMWPLEIGAVLAGSDEETTRHLRAFSEPLGIAFQLQDDILGVFGDPERTGKPAGDDLREGKRTELIAHAMELLPTEDRQVLDNSLGNPELSADDVSGLQKMLEDCGARERVTQEVESLGAQALEALSTFDLDGGVVEELQALTEQLLHRQH